MTARRPKQPATPDWVPDAVKNAALRLPPSDIVTRLLTDARMKSVWAYLARHEADPTPVLAMELFDERMPPHSASARDRASAAFFFTIVDDLTRKTKIAKRSEVRLQAKTYFDAAKLCRETIPDAEVLTNGFFEAGETLNFDLAKALGVIADIFESRGDCISANKPEVIARSAKSRGDDVLRVTARKIATTFFRFYGNYNYGLTAVVTSVVTGADVSKKSIENWCADKSRKSPI